MRSVIFTNNIRDEFSQNLYRGKNSNHEESFTRRYLMSDSTEQFLLLPIWLE